ncbi:class I SAM-dependent methyltransferase [Candidatus Altiarchaeota archaeon]
MSKAKNMKCHLTIFEIPYFLTFFPIYTMSVTKHSSSGRERDTRNLDASLPDVGSVKDLRADPSGERLEFFGYRHTIYREHILRYRFALQNIPDLKRSNVLDVGCGVGYGSAALARKAKHVVGIDNSRKALERGEKKYVKGVTGRKQVSNLSLRQMSAEAISFPDDSFDHVVSFENLEHLEHPEKMLAGVRRVLKNGGVLILSTPNKKSFRQIDGKPINPFHIREFTKEELEGMLKEHFSEVEFYGQSFLSDKESDRRDKVQLAVSLDKLRLRRLVPRQIRTLLKGKTKKGAAIAPLKDNPGKTPEYFIVVCR